jgi:hypothetical protein
MQNELHPARFIEETFHHERLLRRNRAERSIRVGEVIGDLLSSVCRAAIISERHIRDVFARRSAYFSISIAQIRNRVRKLRVRAGASPSQNGIPGG